MRISRYIPALVALALGQAHAQAPSLNFTADTVTGTGELTPTLTWSTDPPADACTAFGDWSGDKGAAGEQQIAALSSSAEFALECDWFGNSNVTLHWLNPTENTDGTPYTDHAQTIIRYRRNGEARHQRGAGLSVEETLEDCGEGLDDVRCVSGLSPEFSTHTLTSLALGQWMFVAHSCNGVNVCSQASAPAETTVTQTQTVRETVTITVSAIPRAPVNLEAVQ